MVAEPKWVFWERRWRKRWPRDHWADVLEQSQRLLGRRALLEGLVRESDHWCDPDVPPHLADAMERVAVRAQSIQDWNSLEDWIDGNVRDEYEGPLWAVLVQHTGGEVRTVVLNQKMNQGKPDGFAALGMLAERYNPKTSSRILHALTVVLSPPTVKDVRQAPRMVEEWEASKGTAHSRVR